MIKAAFMGKTDDIFPPDPPNVVDVETERGRFWTDGINFVTFDGHTKEDAIRLLTSLEDCSDCYDCYLCERCSECVSCSVCDDCECCSDSSTLVRCKNCQGLKNGGFDLIDNQKTEEENDND